MRPHILPSLLTVLLAAFAVSGQNTDVPCPPLGADLPAPSYPSQSAAIKAATSALDPSTSFSVDVFSAHESKSIFTYHYTAPELKSAQNGTKKVDSSTIYRIGSITKVFTVYAWLLESGFSNFHNPITKYVPELSAPASPNSALNTVDWKEVTIGALASHLAGLSRDIPPPLAFDQQVADSTGLLLGPPPQHVTFCGEDVFPIPCTRSDFFNAILPLHNVFPTFKTPSYSNIAFALLGYALENITSNPISDILQSQIFKPLHLTSTFSILPLPFTLPNAIIPPGSWPWYSTNLSSYTAVGAIYSTITDLHAFSSSILNCTFLPLSTTRHWLQPQAFASGPGVAIGSPWEIALAPTARTSYMYAKSGGLGTYEPELVFLPDWDAGMTILSCGSTPQSASQSTRLLSSLLAAYFPAALEQATKEEAMAKYAGTYHNAQLNGSILLSVDTDGLYPGLRIDAASHLNGTALSSLVISLLGSSPATFAAAGERLSLRLYPSGLSETSADGSSTQGWRMVYQPLPDKGVGWAFSEACATCAGFNAVVAGEVGLDEVVFEVGRGGEATGMEMRVLGRGKGNLLFTKS